MKDKLSKVKEFIKKLELKTLVLNVYAFCLFMLPVIPEAGRYAVESRKWVIYNSITICAAIALLIINIVDKKFKLNKYDGLLIIYLVLVGISTVLTKFDIWKAITGENGRGEGLLTITNYVITFIIFSKGYKRLKGSVKIAVFAACVVAIYSLFQVLLPSDVKFPTGLERRGNYATGTMRNQNFLSSYMCLFLPMMTFLYINRPRLIKLLEVALIFCGLVTSMTLGGYLTCIFMLACVLIGSLVYSKHKLKLLRNFTVVLLVFVVLFIALDANKDGAYKRELLGYTTETGSTVLDKSSAGNGRVFVWKKSLSVLSEHPWFGVGPDSLRKEINNVKKYGNNKPVNNQVIDKAHSEPLQIAVTTGIPSMMTYLVFAITLFIELFVYIIKSLNKDKDKLDNDVHLYNTMIFISIISYFVQSLINISVIHVAPIYWAMLGLGTGIMLNNEKVDKKKKC